MNSQIFNRDILFKKLLIAIWATLVIYLPISYLLGHVEAIFFLGLGAVIIKPFTLFLFNKGKTESAKVFFIFSGLFYLISCDSVTRFETQAQVYLFPIIILTFLIFDEKKIKSILFCLFLVFGSWCLSEFTGEMIPQKWINTNIDIETFRKVHFFLASCLTVVLVSIFVHTIIGLTHESREMLTLIERTQSDAKIGSWSLLFETNELFWSEETYRIHEVPSGEKVDVNKAINFYHPEERERISRYVETAIKNGEPWDDEFRFITAKGCHLWVRAIGRVFFNKKKEPFKAEGSFQDITEKKKAELAKETFLSTMSHEMRTPLTAIIGMSELLEETTLDNDQKEYSSTIKKAGDSLLNIINDILDLSKLSNQKLSLKLENANLKFICEEVIELLKVKADQKNLVLKIDYDSHQENFKLDPTRTRQILYNILGNAIKFTDQGHVCLRVQEVQNQVFLEIEDTGKGISTDALPYIFTPFEQDIGERASADGTGLGLSITKSLVELMGGKIEIESELEKGTKLKVLLPFEPVQKMAIVSQNPIKHESLEFLNGLNILAVDDTDINLKLLERLLGKQKSNVKTLSNGEEALEYYKNNSSSVDLIIMDIQMPIMDGLTATKEIRKFEKEQDLKPIPILAFSAFAFKEDFDKSLAAGCTNHLAKPVKKENLFQTISKALAA